MPLQEQGEQELSGVMLPAIMGSEIGRMKRSAITFQTYFLYSYPRNIHFKELIFGGKQKQEKKKKKKS